MHSPLQTQAKVSNGWKEKMGYLGTDRAAEAHRSMRQPCIQPCDLGGAQGTADDSRSVRTPKQSGRKRAGTRLQAGVQGQQLASHGGAPGRKAKQRGHRARREPVANPAGSLPVSEGGKPWQEGGLCGRKTWQAACPHGGERPGGDTGARQGRSGARSPGGARGGGSPPSPRHWGRPPQPVGAAGRRAGGRRRRASSTRGGTARPSPGVPKGFLPPSRTPAGRTGVTPRPLHSPFAGSLLLGHGGGAVVGS